MSFGFALDGVDDVSNAAQTTITGDESTFLNNNNEWSSDDLIFLRSIMYIERSWHIVCVDKKFWWCRGTTNGRAITVIIRV